MNFSHISVLLNESIEALNIKEGLVYVDATTGGAGHSMEIVKKLKRGKLFCFDKDPDAIKIAKKRLSEFDFVEIIGSDFLYIKEELEKRNVSHVDGILMDLGVSSHRLDTKDRGFSYHQNAPLDMRMSQDGLSAYDIVNNYDEKQLSSIIFKYGEEKYSFKIAKEIIKSRENKPINTTFELVDIIKAAVPASYKRKGNPAKKTFQAIRIAVNGELDNLEAAIEKAVSILNKNGRLAIISFHSLEDRIVKKTLHKFTQGCICPKELPVCVCKNEPVGKLVFKKPVIPNEKELFNNRRSRSAKLRVFEKIV